MRACSNCALHRVEARQHSEEVPLGLAVARRLLDRRLAPVDRLVDERGAERGRGRVGRRRAPLLTHVARPPRVLASHVVTPRRRRRSGMLSRPPRRRGATPSRDPPRRQPARRRRSSPAISCSTVSGRQPSAPVRRRTRSCDQSRTRRGSRCDVWRGRSPPPARPMPPRTDPSSGAPRHTPEARQAAPGGRLGRRAAARPSKPAAAGTSPRANARRPADARRRAPSSPISRPRSSSGPSSERYVQACSRW